MDGDNKKTRQTSLFKKVEKRVYIYSRKNSPHKPTVLSKNERGCLEGGDNAKTGIAVKAFKSCICPIWIAGDHVSSLTTKHEGKLHGGTCDLAVGGFEPR